MVVFFHEDLRRLFIILESRRFAVLLGGDFNNSTSLLMMRKHGFFVSLVSFCLVL